MTNSIAPAPERNYNLLLIRALRRLIASEHEEVLRLRQEVKRLTANKAARCSSLQRKRADRDQSHLAKMRESVEKYKESKNRSFP